MDRQHDLEEAYQALALLVRRARELSNQCHPEVSMVTYTMLRYLSSHRGTRAQDLADHFDLDKSTVSRQVDELERLGLVARTEGRPGARGVIIALTRQGQRALDDNARAVRCHLAERLSHWSDEQVVSFTRAINDFNATSELGAQTVSGPAPPSGRR